MFNATFIVTVISFIVFAFVMNSILYKPMSEIVSKRQKLIDENYETAKTNQSKSKVILSEREEKLIEAKASSKQKISKAIEDANSIRTQKISQAKKEANTVIKDNQNVLNEEKQKSINPLKNEVVGLAQTISDKILKNHEKIENFDNQLVEKLIQG